MKILVTGGTGYIGSHTCVELLNNGYDVVVVDNLCNSKLEVRDRIEKITGKKIKMYVDDVCDKTAMRKIFEENDIDGVIHFAGLKAVGESVSKPLMYYRNNLDSSLTLFEVMSEFGCKKIVFSSSATVYGVPEELPIKESAKLSVTNPYGATKLYIEGILKDLYVSDNDFRIVILRYFNPVGSHESFLIGEDPMGIPNNLMPYVTKVATGELPILSIFGDDYDTCDGTGVRDYIHVVDLARGHIKAIEYINNNKGIDVFNLGTGIGYSVLEIVNTFMKVNNISVPYKITGRRDGDIAVCYADNKYAREKLNWVATHDLEDMVSSAYKYAVMHNRK